MKKIISIVLILLGFTNLHAQRSASEIKDIIIQDFEKTVEKYEFEEACDSILLKVDRLLAETESRHQPNPTASDLCEAAVWHSFKASLLSGMFSEMRYTIQSRTAVEGASGNDWKTWDRSTFQRRILDEFYASLQEKPILISASSEPYYKLFNMPREKECYPNLYDLLAYRFADQLQSSLPIGFEPAEEFNLNTEEYFGKFLPEIKTRDTLSTHYHFLSILREIEQEHRNDTDPDYRLYNRLVRLAYVKQNARLQDNESLYLAALQNLMEEGKNASNFIKQLICCELGIFYQDRGDKPETQPDDFVTAIHWYEAAIEYASESKCAKTCQENIMKIKERRYSLSLPNKILYPEENLICACTKDCDKLHYAIVRYSNLYEKRHKQDEKITLDIVCKEDLNINNSKRYRIDTTLFVLPALETGEYLLLTYKKEIENPVTYATFNKYQRVDFHVSRLTAHYATDSTDLNVWVCDRKTGEPLQGVDVILKAANYKHPNYKSTLRTDENGVVHFSKEAVFQWFDNSYYFSTSLSLKKGSDQLPESDINIDRNPTNYTQVSCTAYTDRAIYRPGQTVEWKAIFLSRSNYSDQLLPNTKFTVQLEDGNGTVVQRDTLTTNKFGSAAGSFKLPESGFLGNYHLVFRHKDNYVTSRSIRVEEYKRPTFEAVMDKPDGTYRLGSEVRINGTATAYAGYAIHGANVTYRVTRNASFPFRSHGWWFRPRPIVPEKEIAHGECVTDDDGRFTIVFTADGDPTLAESLPLYHYTVTATVSDPTGETHEVRAVVPISHRTLLFDVELPDCLRAYLNENRIAVRTNNLAGEPQTAEVRYQVVRLAQPSTYKMPAPYTVSGASEKFGNRFPQYDFEGQNETFQWKETLTMETGEITTSTSSEVILKKISTYPTGTYKLKLTTTDTFGQAIEEEFCFYVAQKEGDLPYHTALSVTCDKERATVGETITFTIGTRLKRQPVLIRIFNNANLLEEKWIHLDNGTYLYKHMVKSGEEGTFCCQAHTHWENQTYSESSTLRVPEVQRQIHFDFVSFRDKSQPGGRETVKIRLTDGSGRPIPAAEMLCALYDASLDVFAPNYFANTLFTDRKPLANSLYPLRSNYLYTPYSWNGNSPIHYDLFLPSWNNFARNLGRYFYRGIEASVRLCANSPMREDFSFAINEIAEEDAEPMTGFQSAEKTLDDRSDEQNASTALAKGAAEEEVPLRSNFNETAFFYPFLTVQDGVVEFEYTLPESLTKWKMLGAAHTKNRQYGTFEKFVVTQKPLMVSPNLPRFVYAGDQWEFAVKVVNLSGERLEGEVDIQFHDAKDGSVILADKREVRLDSGATELIQEFVRIPEGFVGVTYVVTVEASGGGNTYSDGETGDVPVLSRKQIVTEALPLFITKKGSRTFSLKNLPASSSSILSCKLQFTPDPRWNAILALPYLMEYPYNCNEQIFSKLYANTVASYIIAQNPNFQSLIQNAMETQPEALRSRLVQNADLKQILLAETPWVTDAMNEDNEIQNIACLFDRQNIAEQRKAMVQKLERNQNADGGWNWFSSRYNERSNRYITQHLLIGSGRLMSKGVCKAGDNFLKESTLNRAVNFIDRDVEKEYQEYKKMQKKDSTLPEPQLTADLLHYLYTRSFFLKRKPANTDAYQYYKGELMEQAATLTGIYQKTLAALTLWQTNGKGDRELAKQLMLSIKKRAIHSEEMGMYWKKEGHGWFWYEAPIERQSLLIEAFQTILKDEESVKEMKIWLLQQKRTQHWSSTRSTADACYALLLDNEKGRTEPAKHITVQLCGETIDFTETLQLPVKKDIESCLQDGSNGTVTLTRDDDGLSYGGVFVRYYKDIDEIEGTGTEMPLSVERQLYKVSYGDRGELLTELGAGGALQVGDRVRVRMVLRADRDMEFVHLKDLRAAAFEPTETLSGYRWQDGLCYYQSFRDASVNFFFDWLRKGTYVFEYTLFVTQSGEYSSGYASIQCMYAPEFCAHSASSGRITVRNRK